MSSRAALRTVAVVAVSTIVACGLPRTRARADDGRTVAIAQMEVQGDGVPAVADLAAAVRRGFQAAGLTVAAQGPAPAATGCEDAACLRRLSSAYGAALLAFAHVHSGPQRYDVDIRVVAAASGETVTTDAVVCRVDDLCPPMTETVQRLAKEAGRKTKARLAEMAPVAADAATPQLEFAPPRIYDTDEASMPAQRPSWVPWALAAGGTAALVGGGLALAANDTCEGTPARGEGCSVRSHAALGWTLSALGLASVGLATALWLGEASAAEERPNVALAGWAQPGGAGISLSGRWR